MAVERRSLRLPGVLLLAGQLSYIVATLFHADGPANNHPVVFAEYAASTTWTAVHLAQFACTVVMLAGLLALSFALDTQGDGPLSVSRFGAATTVATLALYGGVLAVDGVALKGAVTAWASAPAAEKAARFATAEAMRWLEWGMRSYENFALGLAVILLAVAVARAASIPWLIAVLMGLAGLTYWVQGWVAGSEGFSNAETDAIIVAEILNVVWMIWLIVVGWRMKDSGSPVATV